MDEYDIQDLYLWIDELPLSRPKRNITRDFSDGVLAAEIVHHFLPKAVDLHNYQPANSIAQKTTNWTTLNNKVLKKIGLTVPNNVIQGVASQKPGVIEVVLNNLRLKLQQHLAPPRAQVEVGGGLDYDGNEAEEYDMPPPPPSRDPPRRKKKNGSTLPPLGNRSSTMPPQRRKAPRPPAPQSRNGGLSGAYYAPAPPPPRDNDYDDLAAELEECHEQMSVMQIKIEKLTRLVHLKDKRIEDLQRSVRAQR